MARPPSALRLIDPAPDTLEPVDVDVPTNEVAPGVIIDGGVMHIDHGDGSVTLDFDPKDDEEEESDDGFYGNLVGKIEEAELAAIATDLLDGIKRDLESRKEWLETRARGIQLLGLKLEEPRGDTGMDSAPLEGMSTVRHPLLLDATINFQATARGELLPATGPVKVRVDTPPRPTPPEQRSPAGSPPTTAGSQSGSQSPSAPPSGATGTAGAGAAPPQPAPAPSSAPGGSLPPPGPTAAGSQSPAPAATNSNVGPTPTAAPVDEGGSNPAQDASPFATEYAIPPIEEKDTLAQALELDFNHYLTVTAEEYYDDTDTMLFYVGFGGDGFKKVFNCPLKRRPVCKSVDAEDLIVSNSAVNLADCGRITHRIRMRKSMIKRMQIDGGWADFELGTPQEEKTDPVKEEKQDIFGINPLTQKADERDHIIYECYCELDLDQFAPEHFKGKALPLPYIVTIEETSRKILCIRRNWKEDDEQALPKQFFVQFPLVRGLGFYGLGFIHLLGNTTSTLTAIWREAIDAGMFGNFPGFLYNKSFGRQLTNQFRIPPGGGQGIDVPANMRIQDAVMPLPYKDVGASFTAFAQWVEQAGQRLGQTAQIAVGEGKQEVPVGTTLALIEQATKIINSAHKRLHAAQSKEFMLLKERFKEDPEAFWRSNPKPAMPWEKEQFLKALDDYNIVPVADPNNPTSLHRAAKAQIIEGTASKYPQLINGQAALKRIYRIAGIDTEGLFYDKPLPPPPDPRMVAIQQKSESTQQTVQAQTQAAMAKTIGQVILGLKQVEQKTQDAQQRAVLDQARLLLEAHQYAGEQQNADRDAAREHFGRMSEIAADQASAAQERENQRLQKMQELQMERARQGHEMVTDAIRGNAEHQTDMQQQQAENELELRKHTQKLAREEEAHRRKMAQDDEAHRRKMEQQQQMHEAQLAQARALAEVKKTANSKTTKKTTKQNATGTHKTETTETS